MTPQNNEDEYSIKFPRLVEQKPQQDIPTTTGGRELSEAEIGRKLDYPFWGTMVDMWNQGYVGAQIKKSYYDLQSVGAELLSKGSSFISDDFSKLSKQVSNYFIQESLEQREKIADIISQQVPDDRLGIVDKVQKSAAIAIGNLPATMVDLLAIKALPRNTAALYFTAKNASDGFVRASIDLERNFPNNPDNEGKALMKGTVDGLIGGALDFAGTKLLSNPQLKNTIGQSITKYLGSIGTNVAENVVERGMDELISISPDRNEFSREEISDAIFNEVLPNVFTTVTKLGNEIRLKKLSEQFDAQKTATIDKLEQQITTLPQGDRKESLEDVKFFAQNLNEPSTFRRFSENFSENKFKSLLTLVRYTDNEFEKMLDTSIKKRDLTLAQEWIGKEVGIYDLEKMFSEEVLTDPKKLKQARRDVEFLVRKQGQAKSGGLLLSRLIAGDEIFVKKFPATNQRYVPEIVEFQKPQTPNTSLDTILKTLDKTDVDHYTKWVFDNKQNITRPITDLSPVEQTLHAELTRIKNNVGDYLLDRGIFDIKEYKKFSSELFVPSVSKNKTISDIKTNFLKFNKDSFEDSIQSYNIIPTFVKNMGDALNAGEGNYDLKDTINKVKILKDDMGMDRLIREGGNNLGNTVAIFENGKSKQYVINSIPLYTAITSVVENKPLSGWTKLITGPAQLARNTITSVPLLSIPFKVSMTVKDALQTLSMRPSALLKYPRSIAENITESWRNEMFVNDFSKQLYLRGGKYSGAGYDYRQFQQDAENMVRQKSVIQDLFDKIPDPIKKTVSGVYNVANLDWTEDISRTARAYSMLDKIIGQRKKVLEDNILDQVTAKKISSSEGDKLISEMYNTTDSLKFMDKLKNNDITKTRSDALLYDIIIRDTTDEARRVTKLDRRGSGQLVRFLTSSIPFTNPMLQSAYDFYRETKGVINGSLPKNISSEFMKGIGLSIAAGVVAGMTEDPTDDTDDKFTSRMKIKDMYVIPTGFPISQLFINTGRIMGHSWRASVEPNTIERDKNKQASEKLLGSLPMTVLSSYGGTGLSLNSPTALATGMRAFGIDKNFNKYKNRGPNYVTDTTSTSTSRDISKLVYDLSGEEIDLPPKQIEDITQGLLNTVYRVGKASYEGITDRSEQSMSEIVADMFGYSLYKYKPQLLTQDMLDFWEEKASKIYFSNIVSSYKNEVTAAAYSDQIAKEYGIDLPKMKISPYITKKFDEMITDETMLTEKKIEEVSVNNPAVQNTLKQMRITLNGIQQIRMNTEYTPDQKKQLIKSAVLELRSLEERIGQVAELIWGQSPSAKK